MNRWILAVLVACAGALGAVSTADAGDFTVPAAWEGVWNISEIERDCGTTGGIPEEDVDVLCTGDSVFDGPGECSGTITDTSVNISCETIQDLGFPGFPDCMLTQSFSLIASRSGDSYTATSTSAITYTGCPGTLVDTCFEVVTDGTRTGADPECDLMPVLPTSWTEIKAVF